MHPDFSAGKIEKKSAQIMQANTVIKGRNVNRNSLGRAEHD